MSPKVLPTMVVGDDEDDIVLHEIIEAALSSDDSARFMTPPVGARRPRWNCARPRPGRDHHHGVGGQSAR